MWKSLVNLRLIVVLAIALVTIGAFACSADEDAETPAAPAAPSAPSAPQTAATSVPSAAQTEPDAPEAPDQPDAAQEPAAATEPDAPDAVDDTPAATTAPERTAPSRQTAAAGEADAYGRVAAAFGGDWYVPAKLVPGEVRSYHYDGPRPTSWQENPAFATMVANGELLTLEERWVSEDDRLIIDVDDEIGVYGGSWRIGIGGWVLDYAQWAPNFCTEHDSDFVTEKAWMCKSAEVNDDGTTWTFTFRDGMRWWHPASTDPVAGQPATMEQVKFAWEDLNFDVKKGDSAPWRARFPEIYLRGYPQPAYHDAVTGELPDFTPLDEFAFTLSWTSPNWNFLPLAYYTKGTRCEAYCFIAPKFHVTRYHPEYGDPDDIDQLMSDGGFASWTELIAHHFSIFSDTQTLLPWLGEAILIRGGSDDQPEAFLLANPMFWAADPVGNQLPYYDSQHFIRYESQEVATFRAMAGENDGGSTGFVVNELPMYQANMEKGDYSIYGWMNLGADGMAQLNQTYNEDPEMGRWIRDIEFRQALAFGLDRDALNQTSNLGLGTLNSAAPHPSSQYYPGEEWSVMFTDYDPAEAMKRLDALGLTDTDGDGIRNYTGVLGGSTKNFGFFGGTSTDLRRADRSDNPALIFQENMADIGLAFDFKPDSQFASAIRSNKEYFTLVSGFAGNPYNMFPSYCGSHQAALIGCWFVAKGAGGGVETEYPPMLPGVADASYLPIAPSNTWAADANGDFMKFWNNHETGVAYSSTDPRNIEAGRNIYELTVNNQWTLSTVAFVPRKVFIKRNNFRNVSRNSFGRFDGYNTAVYYFEDGMDNENNAGNRSKRYKSESFLTGLTY